ncbi:MAG: acyltransferase [Methanosarcinales archaeon]|nr:acyltransferase [Methanosarcinales archaeon]
MNKAKTISSAHASGTQYNTPIAYLRAFIIVLVVAQHAAMPYHIIPPQSNASSLSEYLQSIRAISPVIDEQRSDMLSLFASFNDNFFMALLFLLSGLFVWNSLQRKGRFIYFRERLIRLGLPLAVMVILRPLTYYMTYLQTGGNSGLSDFWQQWSLVEWRGGPIWFIELLLVFDIIVVLAAGMKVNMSGLFKTMQPFQPVKFFMLLVLLSAVAYIPISAIFDSFFWLQVGPAQIQINRLFLYAVYFLAGIFFGAYGIERTFLVPNSKLARRWIIWTVAALVTFLISVIISISSANEILIGFFYIFSCATISFAFLAIFLRFAQRQRRIFDSFFHNSYGVYVIHYGVVSCLSYALLGAQLPAMAKWSIVFTSALVLCWGAVAVIRRIPGVGRVI